MAFTWDVHLLKHDIDTSVDYSVGICSKLAHFTV